MDMEGKKGWSNLEAFLEAATPELPWRSTPMECFQESNNIWKDDNKDVIEYFTLEDLWGHYTDSSAYGLGVPVRLDTGEAITQHFVPYLSAIQIYTTKALALRRSMGSESDSWSDDSMGDKLSGSWDAASDDSTHEDSDYMAEKHTWPLNFQYMDWNSPYERLPLADKYCVVHQVAELAQDPCLTSLKSAELSPSSWISVAWYPIYHIPAHGNQKGMSTCFLTYHTISSVFQENIRCSAESDESHKIVALSPFGLATHRLEGDLWRKPGSSDSRRIHGLYSAAFSWLKQVKVHHPDFNFFTTH